MRSKYFILAAIILISSCKCNNDKNKPTAADSVLVIPDTLLVYEVDAENKTIKQYTEVPDSAFTPVRVVNGLNQKYPEVPLQLVKQSNDTVYVAIPQSEFLGERMGSTGAMAWFADAVLNLTAIQGVKYVNIDMEKHSHALPGVFSKEDFEGFTVVNDSIPAN